MIEEQSISVAGWTLHRLILRPASPPRAALIFFHGQGDYIDRYPEYLTPFLEADILIILTDLPGHGRSPGTRGAIPGMAMVTKVFENSLQQLPANIPYGIAGHSMGGMLALRFYLRYREKFSFAWFSSPLLSPAARISPFLKWALLLLGRFLPWIRRSTGVKSDDCRTPESNITKKSVEQTLYHDRISLSWARDLMTTAEELSSTFASIPLDCPILFTQGTDDPVCPPEYLTNRLTKVSEQSQITLELIENALHEPFTNQEDFKKRLKKWLKSLQIHPESSH